MAGLLDFIQGASNAAASNVSAPVDGIAWLLRKAGVPIPAAPVGGSDWMAQNGLTRPANGVAGLLGESVGGVLPMVAQAGAPQISKGLLSMGDNLSAPSTLNKQAGVILYHGSNDSKPVKAIHDGGVFGGIFASPSKNSANSHGGSLYRMTVPDNAVMPVDADVPYDDALNVVKSFLRGSTHADDITEMAISGRGGLFDSKIPEDDLLNAFRASDLGEADWALQNLRGQIAKKFGYKAVEMPDEHGMSYLVLPGTTPRPYNDQAKQAFRSLQKK